MFAAGRKSADRSESSSASGSLEWLNVGKSFEGVLPSTKALVERGKDDSSQSSDGENSAFENLSFSSSPRASPRSKRGKREKSGKKEKSGKRSSKKKKKRKRQSLSESEDENSRKKKHSKKHIKRSSSKSTHSENERALQQTKKRTKSHKKSSSVKRIESADIRAVCEEENDIFHVDKRGDFDALSYGCIYAADLPSYRLQSNLLINSSRNTAGSAFITYHKPHRTGPVGNNGGSRQRVAGARYFSPEVRSELFSKSLKRIRFARNVKRKKRAELRKEYESMGLIVESNEMEFIPLPSTSALDDEEYVNDADLAEQEAVRQSKAYNEKIKANPSDVCKWLEFLAFQELSVRTKPSKASVRRVLFEKQHAILQRAIEQNPSSTRLRDALINLYLSQDVEENQILALFTAELSKRPNDLTLWNGYLNCHCRQFSTFTVSDFRKVASNALDALRSVFARKLKEKFQALKQSTRVFHPDSLLADTAASATLAHKNTEQDGTLGDLMELFHTVCRLDRASGYTEHSIALYQAWFEFNLDFPHALLSKEFLTTLQLYEEYYDREDLRFGQSLPWNETNPHQITWAEWLEKEQGIRNINGKRWERVPGIQSIALDLSEVKGNAERALKWWNEYVDDQMLCAKDLALQFLEGQDEKRDLNGELDTNSYQEDIISGSREREVETKTGYGSSKSDTEDEDDGFAYSVLHGYRIQLNEVETMDEYRRALAQIKGQDVEELELDKESSGAARRETKRKKRKKKRVQDDERTGFESVGEDDPCIEWLREEENRHWKEWMALQSSSSATDENNENKNNNDEEEEEDEDEEIDADRVVLHDEISPFLFPVQPLTAVHCRRMLYGLLEIMHVELPCFSGNTRRNTSVFWDSFETRNIFVQTLKELLSGSHSSKVLCGHSERLNVLSQDLRTSLRVPVATAMDPSKVAFLRCCILQCIAKFSTDVALFTLLLQFERETAVTVKNYLLCRCGNTREDADERKEYVEDFTRRAKDVSKLILQRINALSKEKQTRVDTVMDAWSEYAETEYTLGSLKEGNRVLDKAIALEGASNKVPGMARVTGELHVHRLLFMRVRAEAWGAEQSYSAEERRWRGLFVLSTGLGRAVGSINKVLRGKTSEKDRVSALKIAVGDNSVEIMNDHVEDELMEGWQQLDFGLGEEQVSSFPYAVHNAALIKYWRENNQDVTSSAEVYEEWVEKYEAALARLATPTVGKWREKTAVLVDFEWLLTCYLEHLQFHAAVSVLSPGILRRVCLRALGHFPLNSTFLWLFLQLEQKASMSHRLRDYFFQIAKKHRHFFQTPEPEEWLFVIFSEVCRAEKENRMDQETRLGTLITSHNVVRDAKQPAKRNLHKEWSPVATNRVRVAFEQCINSVKTKGCAIMWRLYLRFEVAVGCVENAKRVLFRGIRHCPWSKNLYLDSIRELRTYLPMSEVEDMKKLSHSKEIYIRVNDNEDDDNSEDESENEEY